VGEPAVTWLLLATPDLGREVASLAPDVRVDVEADPARFLAQLAAHRPHLAVVTVPPARPRTIDLVAEASRAGGFPAVLIDDPEAVDERLEALAAGLAEALPSDASPREIVGRLRLLAARANGHGPVPPRTIAIAEGTVLDLSAHALVRHGVRMHLRPKELALLATMASEPGRVFTRRELDERAWGNHRPDSRRVDVHVRWLRLKVEPDPDAPRHILTVRRVGYRLDPEATLTSP
jgi:DNA-binding response OmpR family regulator